MKPATMTNLTVFASILLAVILILIPFQAFLTIVASGLTGSYELWRLWKELILLLLSPVVGLVLWRNRQLWQRLRQGWLFWAIACYILLHFALGVTALLKGQVNAYALLYAWVVNLRPMAIFVAALVLASSVPWLRVHWKKLLLWPAAIVVGFGLLQVAVLPIDFLSHFGYGPATIAPYETVDEKLDYIRVQSTLRGSNPLGAYLVVIMAVLLVLLRRARSKTNGWLAVGLLASATLLFYTYSRSAYIGFALMFLASVVLAVRNRQERRWLAMALVVLAIVSAGLVVAFRENDYLENTLYHTNEDSTSVSDSNEQRWLAMRSGFSDVINEPFGRGPGTAGPASIHNSQPGRIAENYYLQIGQETGWLGVGLFVAIVLMVGRELWRRRSDPLARSLLVSLVGISFINLVQHAWTDDTLAVVWWGFAGVAISAIAQPAILKHTKQKHEKVKQTIQAKRRKKTSAAAP